MSVLRIGQYFGRVPERWSAEGVALSPVVHDHGRRNVPHVHAAAFVTMMLSGDYREVAARRTIQFDPFSAVYHGAGIEHQDSIGAPGVRLLIFEFDPAVLEGVDLAPSQGMSLRDVSGSRPAFELLALYRDARRDCERLDFETRALELTAHFARLAPETSRDPARVRTAREYLDAHFRRRLFVHDVAAAAGIHPVYLGQLFRRECGETISDYVTRLRVRAAAAELSKRDMSLADIALQCGFCDQSHFQRAFRRLSGVTPCAFRQSSAL